MKVHAMGIGNAHGEFFRIDRPCGSGDNLFLIFCNKSYMELNDRHIEIPPYSGLIYSLGTPQLYGAAEKEYTNHWVHFECDENDIFFDRIGLKFNEPFPVSDIMATEKILEMLSVESLSDGNEECADLLMRLLFAKLCSARDNTESTPHSASLKQLRAEIYSSPSEKFTVKTLAESLNLSPSYFQHLYRKQFGISCYDDVLRARLELAKHYLLSTNFTVSEISALCGYENDVHFMRQFRKKTGMTPCEFRAGGH